MKRILVTAISLCLMLGLAFGAVSVEASPATIVVPDDQPTIQQAIDAAGSGDTVYVRSGTYYEHVTIDKSLTLQGEDRETTIIDGGGSGKVIYVIANHVTISGLTVTNGENGIDLIADWVINHITIRDVIITSNSYCAFWAGHSGGYHLIEDCIISDNGGASYAHQFGNSIIRNCEVFGNGGGLSVAWGSGTLITNNRVHDNGAHGIWFDSMFNSIMEKNEVYNNGVGIGVGYVGKDNTLRDNIVHHNTVGIEMNYPPVIGNKVYHNALVENTLQVRELGSNIWDNGYPSGGNYWSDYAGVDDYSGPGQNLPGSDGIGDTPYAFIGNQDNYPLMEPFEPIAGVQTQCAESATGTGTACITTSHGFIFTEDLKAVPPHSLPSVLFPHGMFDFRITGLTPGQTVTLTIEFPSPLPIGTLWWKYDNGRWHGLPNENDNGDHIMVITLTDGGIGDLDNIPGQITDPGGPGNPMTVGWETSPIGKAGVVIPWIALLAAIVGGGSLLAWRRRRAQI